MAFPSQSLPQNSISVSFYCILVLLTLDYLHDGIFFLVNYRILNFVNLFLMDQMLFMLSLLFVFYSLVSTIYFLCFEYYRFTFSFASLCSGNIKAINLQLFFSKISTESYTIKTLTRHCFSCILQMLYFRNRLKYF